MREKRTAVLRSNVGTLTLPLRGIVRTVEKLNEFCVRYFGL